jgi:hypothetical protein
MKRTYLGLIFIVLISIFGFTNPVLADSVGKIIAVINQIFGGSVDGTGASAGQALVKQSDGSWKPGSPSSSPSFPLLAPDGSSGAPSYSFSATPTVGLYHPTGLAQIGLTGALTWASGLSNSGIVGPGDAHLLITSLSGIDITCGSVGQFSADSSGNPTLAGNSTITFQTFTQSSTVVFGIGGGRTPNVVINGTGTALQQNATGGFLYLPTCSTGAPNGTPSAFTGDAPLIIGGNNHLYMYVGGAWVQVDGGGTPTWAQVLAAGSVSGGTSPLITSGDLLRFNGTSSSFPALKKNASGNFVESRLADDSAGVPFGATEVYLGGAGNYDVGIKRVSGGKLQITDTTTNDADLQAANGVFSGSTGLTLSNAPGADAALVTADGTHSGASFTFVWFGAAGARDVALYRSGTGLLKVNDTGATNYATIGNGGANLQAAGIFSWSSTTDATAAADTCLSRDAAGIIDFGTGTQGSKAGSWKATNGSLIGKISLYNNITTAGSGVPAIYSAANITAQSAAATITSYAVPVGSDGDFEISGQVNVTAVTALSTTLRVSYTDVNSASQNIDLPVEGGSGFVSTGTINGTGTWESLTIHVRAKNNTTITLKTNTGTFTGVTYSASGAIRQLQ